MTTQLRAVEDLDSELAKILPERDSLPAALQRLVTITPEELLVEEAFERRRLWQDSGLYYMQVGRLREAIGLFSRLHEKICELAVAKEDWLPRGMPLVWVSDCYRQLGCPHLAFRYLLLSGVSDAVRDQGRLNPNAGFYWRAHWQEGLSDYAMRKFYSDSFKEFQVGSRYRFFPEHMLSKVDRALIYPYPSEKELDIYAINSYYARTCLANIDAAHGAGERVNGKELEALSGYLLGCVPGFEVEMDITTGESQLDGIIRNRGPRYDFRQDFGTYIVVECKDWSKRVGSKEVGWLVNKLLTQECKAGILFSCEGITGGRSTADQDTRHAALTLLKAYQRAGKIILVLDRGDLEVAAGGDNLVRILRDKYEEVRFDIRGQRA